MDRVIKNLTVGVVAVTMACAISTSAYSSESASSAPNPTVFYANAPFNPGDQQLAVNIGKVPAGKYFVAQTASVYRTGAGSASSTGVKVLIKATLLGKFGFISLPPTNPDNTYYPSSTLSATFYASSGTELVGYFYREDTSQSEIDFITVTGYLVDGSPNS